MYIVMKYVGEMWHCANLYRTEQYEGLDIGSFQDSYLINICKNPGITQEQLSRLIYVHKSNVARQVSSLEEKGFVVRKQDPADRRNLLLYPTEKAKRAMRRISAVHEKWTELILEGLTEEERAAAVGYVMRLAENAKNIVSGIGVCGSADGGKYCEQVRAGAESDPSACGEEWGRQ